jgi:hypothetical protein
VGGRHAYLGIAARRNRGRTPGPDRPVQRLTSEDGRVPVPLPVALKRRRIDGREYPSHRAHDTAPLLAQIPSEATP